jgi:hypothetical protein|tara:strand:+ start:149 stop:298 length:150 start_codon:yes stop_codon:yes gene_type:complete
MTKVIAIIITIVILSIIFKIGNFIGGPAIGVIAVIAFILSYVPIKKYFK